MPAAQAQHLPSYLKHLPNQAAAQTAPAPSAPSAEAVPPAMVGPAVEPTNKATGPGKLPSRLELAEAALRKSGMSERQLAVVLRDLAREIGSDV
jgi:hypothetical protein